MEHLGLTVHTVLSPSQVTNTFSIKEYQRALDKMNSKEAFKVAVKP
jgi:hypothetical protein